MLLWILVAIGGALGAVSRYGVNSLMNSILGPTVLGTFAANISGSFLLGMFVAVAAGRLDVPEEASAVIAIGFLGSYTTFSTLSVASVQLAAQGDWMRAAMNVTGSVLIGIAAAFAGILVGRAVV